MKKIGRPPFPDPLGMTKAESRIYARLKKGPAALSSLAHAARCKSSGIRVMICRLRRKLPAGWTIPKSFYGHQTYHLETKSSKKSKGTKPRNNMLCAQNFLPDYTLCEALTILGRGVRHLARATMLRSRYVGCGSPLPLPSRFWGRAA